MSEPTLPSPAPRDGAREPRWLAALCLVLPFAFFWWQLPFVSSLSIGNDYKIFPTRHQQELFFSLRLGTFPLFVPGFTGGHSASALTLGQLFHPQSWLAVVSPGYWDGHALEWATFWRLLSLGLTHVVLLRTLLALGLPLLFAALLGGVSVYNLRMLEWFRYGSSLEGYTAFLVACAAATWCWLEPRRWLPRVGLVVATYCLVVSGHPQVMYYGLVGLGLAVLGMPWLVAAARDDPRPGRRAVLSSWGRSALAVGLGLALAAAYALPFYFDFLADNVQRVGRDYAWADGFRDTLVGTFDNFFLPLRSSVGASFGGTALFLVGALTPLAFLARVRVPWVVLALWLLTVLAFLHMQGERTPVHRFVWEHVPLAGSFRIAGRIATLLPLAFALLVAWQVATSRRLRARSPGRPTPLFVTVAVALAATVVWAFLPASLTREHPPWTPFRHPTWSHDVTLWAGAASLAGLLALSRAKGRARAAATGLLVAATLLELGVSLRYGTWVEEKEPTPTFAELRAERRERIDFRGDPGNGLYPSAMVGHYERGPAEPFLAKLYERHVPVADVEEAYRRMETGRDPWTVFVQGLGPEAQPQTVSLVESEVVLERSSFNHLVLGVRAASPAFLGLALPWSRHWSATVDGEPAPLQRANGAYQALRVPAGATTVELRYTSRAAVGGMAISLATLALCVWLFLTRARGVGAGPALFAALVLGPGTFAAYLRSLHGGGDLGTLYRWTPEPHGERENLAYGRRAWVSSLRGPQYTLVLGGRSAVDGMKGRDTGALTRTEKNPVWVVDLTHPSPIGEIVVHEGSRELARESKRDTFDPFNERPLLVQASLDYESWQTVKVIRTPPSGEPLSIVPAEPLRARFVRIVGNETRLALDEVEIYP